MQRRVVVTGISAITPIGQNLKDFWKNCKKGVSGVKDITNLFFIPDHMSQIAGIIDSYHPDSLNIKNASQKEDRALLFARKTSKEALLDARIDQEFISQYTKRCGVYISSAVSQISSMERVFYNDSEGGTKKIDFKKNNNNIYNPFSFSSLASEIAQDINFSGGNMLIPTGCAGGVDSIIYSVHTIRSGRLDVILTGAVEAPITPLVVAAFSKIGATSKKKNDEPQKASRPFDKGRDGFVLAEGAAMLILESLDHALKRGAPIYAEITGVGSVNNCFHMTDIPQDGISIAESCLMALKDAKIRPEYVDLINAHGSSTIQNDIAETNAFHKVFGEKLSKIIPVTSIKSQTGHALAAANAIEVVSSIMSIKENIVPPTINLEEKDELCDLNVIGNYAVEHSVECVLKTSSGFSGIHSSLIIQKFQ